MKKYLKSIFLASFIFFIDAFFFSQGGIALITAVVVVFIMIPRSLFALFKKNRDLFKERMIRAGIYALCVTMVFIAIRLNNTLAANRSEMLIQHCEAFKATYGQYPSKLEDLVPKYIPAVPNAKFSLSHSGFMYISRNDRHLLVYFVMPPFGRRVYHFESGRWTYMD